METGCIRAQLSALLDGELEPAETGRLERHLRGCAACRSRWSLLVALRAAVKDLPGEGVSPGFDAALADRLARERQVRAASPRWREVAWRPFGLAAAATLLLLAVWLAARLQPPSARLRPVATSTGAAFLTPAIAPGLDCGMDEVAEPDARPCASARSCGTASTTAPGLPSTLQRRPVCVRADPYRDLQSRAPARRPVSQLDRGGEHRG